MSGEGELRFFFTYVLLCADGDWYIGSTDDNGILTHSFTQVGHYLLVASKDGYRPDFARINIRSEKTTTVPQKFKPVPSPETVP